MSLSDYENLLDIYGSMYGGEIRKPSLRDNMFSKESLPSIREVALKYLIQDPELKKFQKAFMENNIVNRTTLCLADNTATSYMHMSANIMFGGNIGITVEDDPGNAKQIIDDWNDNINMKHESVEKFFKTAYKDSLMNGDFLWRVYHNKNPDEGDPIIDIQRVSMASLVEEKHDTLGAKRWVQRARIFKKPMNKMAFYRRDPNETVQYMDVNIIIPNEINCCLYLELFDNPPAGTIIKELGLKSWAYWFLRKYIEKFWAPFILAYVGDPKNGYMPKSADMKNQLTWAAQQIRMIRDFGGAAFPATTHLETLETKNKTNSNIYLETIDHLSKEIAIGLHASIATRDSDKQSKAGQDISMQSYILNMKSVREEFSILMRRFYAEVLLPAYGTNNVKPRQIKLTFPEIQTDDIKKIAEAVEIAAKIGAFKDWREIRKIFNNVWKHVDENITDAEEKEMKKSFLELNSPSRAMGDVPQQRAGTTSAKPPK